MNKVFLTTLVLGFILAIFPTASTAKNQKKLKIYTLKQVAKHRTAKNCWLVIDKKVYDVSKFIASQKHPGGAAILKGCGKDATKLFNTRPMGSKTPHSDKARSFLPNFLIGQLAKKK